MRQLLLSPFFFLWLAPLASHAEEVEDIDEVEVVGRRLRPEALPNAYTGSAAQMADTALTNTMQAASVADFLARHSSVFVKESGRGMLSTVSMRGTAASQTAVSWNGIAINSLTMGQTDFSTLPMFFVDQAEIAAGGESAVYGNGAIGGSIDLRTAAPDTARKFSGLFLQSLGSYGHCFSGLKLNAAGKKLWSKTALYYKKADNDFHFRLQDFDGYRTHVQRHAASRGYGLQQLAGWNIDRQRQLSLNLWLTQLQRDIQPSVQNNNDPAKFEDIADRNTRLLLHYAQRRWAELDAKLAYLNDHEEYEGDTIATHNALLQATAARTWERLGWVRSLSARVGAQAQRVVPEVDAYGHGTNEWRNEAFANLVAGLGRRFTATAGMRQQWVSGEDAPFSPSASLRCHALKADSALLDLKASVSRNYRIPTLNDRYWGSLDGRDLRPEDALNCEGGADFSCQLRHASLSLSATAFHNDVSDWILWMPRGNVWKPVNVDRVEVNGAEVVLAAEVKRHSLRASFARSHTEVVRGFAEMRPFQGRQIALIPENNFTAAYTGRLARWKWVLGASHTGMRYTSDVFSTMQAYWLANASLAYEVPLLVNTRLLLQGAVNNLLDADYQTVPYKAMPGRNYQLDVKLKF